ncbi:MAG: 2-C-methyl-D-erythritol 4-phosphate cytidylyltransferase [Ignavibacteriae bacterium]|nr:2-C-methyl-D-erythritol 4-phosphate cytidylyltransferase [Ignavibacteria bacterium]MBI3363634.1 2-C-methyl-D-erythritol 4-phosphate cytidylyltransferase [Ignavibacteriota bacterium]
MTVRESKIGVVIPAAGRGRRMGSNRKKQFLELDGKPIILRTLEHFQSSPLIDVIAIAVSPDAMEEVQNLVKKSGLSKVSHVVCGGEERQDSVWSGLEALRSRSLHYVLIHDGVRPFIDGGLIERIVDVAVHYRAAVPAVRAKETVKLSAADGSIQETLSRERLWLAQTPQGFDFQLLYTAYERARANGFAGTDDASLVERLGEKVRLVEGSYDNIKITTPEDLELAENILRRRKPYIT